MLAVAIPVVQAQIATAQHRQPEAVAWLRKAAEAEDRIAYDEPKNWFFPARHVLGSQLLQMGQAAEAETVYRQDLQQNPANGWSLFGLSAALKSQGKTAEASTVAQQFETAWKYADVKLVASAFEPPGNQSFSSVSRSRPANCESPLRSAAWTAPVSAPRRPGAATRAAWYSFKAS